MTLNVVATSTVAAAVPIGPPVGKSFMVMAVNNVLEALIKVLPVAIVAPPFAVSN